MTITNLTNHELYKRTLGALLHNRNADESESVTVKRLVFECQRRNPRILACAERDAELLRAAAPPAGDEESWTLPQRLTRVNFCTPGELKLILAELGRPIPALSVEEILPEEEGCFVAKAAGNSMAHAGIEDGDVMIVRERESVPDATVCVANVEGQLFVRRLFYRDTVEFCDDAQNVFRVRPKQRWSVLGRVTHAVKPLTFMD